MKKTTADWINPVTRELEPWKGQPLGNKQNQYYIQFLNKDKGFKEDVKDFNSYPDAHSWGKDNIENFTLDQIKWRRSSKV
jgi:hypothetical protein